MSALDTLFNERAPDYDTWGGTPACVDADPEAFFPLKGEPNPMAPLCGTCPVAEPCLDYALALPQCDDYGVWGGTTRNERKTMRRRTGRRSVAA